MTICYTKTKTITNPQNIDQTIIASTTCILFI